MKPDLSEFGEPLNEAEMAEYLASIEQKKQAVQIRMIEAAAPKSTPKKKKKKSLKAKAAAGEAASGAPVSADGAVAAAVGVLSPSDAAAATAVAAPAVGAAPHTNGVAYCSDEAVFAVIDSILARGEKPTCAELKRQCKASFERAKRLIALRTGIATTTPAQLAAPATIAVHIHCS